MSPTKRALLIASPCLGLRGPLNDVTLMSDTLAEQGFEITFCCDQEATRNGILEACRKVIGECEPDDTLVIYYSGHGGIVEDSSSKMPSKEAGVSPAKSAPSRFQFLVPVDFCFNQESNHGDEEKDVNEGDSEFTGILDAEVKKLRAEDSRRTRNVTFILDCCHSGGMSRHPTRDAIPRSLPRVQYTALSRHFNFLRANAQFPEAQESGDAVTIVAAAATETAWEDGTSGQWLGSLTRALAHALAAAWKSGK